MLVPADVLTFPLNKGPDSQVSCITKPKGWIKKKDMPTGVRRAARTATWCGSGYCLESRTDMPVLMGSVDRAATPYQGQNPGLSPAE